jgi:hypothetical protein
MVEALTLVLDAPCGIWFELVGRVLVFALDVLITSLLPLLDW